MPGRGRSRQRCGWPGTRSSSESADKQHGRNRRGKRREQRTWLDFSIAHFYNQGNNSSNKRKGGIILLLSKAWELYESDKRIEGFSPQTLKAYKLQSKLLIQHFNDVNIESLTTDQLKEYLAKSSEHLKPSSLAHRIRFIKSIFRWSHEEGHIPKNPAAKIKEPKQGKRIPKFLTEREIEHLREACFTPMEKALFEFMFSTGCRIGEIVSLDKNCINWSIVLPLCLERVIRKGRYTLIYGVKSGSSDI